MRPAGLKEVVAEELGCLQPKNQGVWAGGREPGRTCEWTLSLPRRLPCFSAGGPHVCRREALGLKRGNKTLQLLRAISETRPALLFTLPTLTKYWEWQTPHQTSELNMVVMVGSCHEYTQCHQITTFKWLNDK